ncbi:4'-phosphopantetheinyl transferase family protein [Promicromonospora sp. NPDC057138]|uniref:4'-phosphopantetheinyl transferase family protein n=1 Tax=Promicromonospora sp. NPDC057138 TaxID=3346031 RepID=UPI0036257E07
MILDVWWSSLAAADRDLLAMLDAGERARVESLERPADRGRSLISAAMLRAAVAAHLGIAPADVVVDRTCAECGGPHGAPRIVSDGTPVPSVSVSHSGLLAVVALVERGPVGVDVQRLGDLADPAEGIGWATREALFKAGTPAPGDVAVHELRPPLPGYVAVAVAPAESDGAPRITHWPRPIRG